MHDGSKPIIYTRCSQTETSHATVSCRTLSSVVVIVVAMSVCFFLSPLVPASSRRFRLLVDIRRPPGPIRDIPLKPSTHVSNA